MPIMNLYHASIEGMIKAVYKQNIYGIFYEYTISVIEVPDFPARRVNMVRMVFTLSFI
jgi:hypothetical protein